MSEVCRFLVGLKIVKEKLNLLKNIWWGEIRLISSPQAAINIVSSCLSNIIHLFTIFNRSNCSHLQTCINDILAATDCQKCLCEVIPDLFPCPTAAPWFLIICLIKNKLRSPCANYYIKILSFQRYSRSWRDPPSQYCFPPRQPSPHEYSAHLPLLWIFAIVPTPLAARLCWTELICCAVSGSGGMGKPPHSLALLCRFSAESLSVMWTSHNQHWIDKKHWHYIRSKLASYVNSGITLDINVFFWRTSTKFWRPKNIFGVQKLPKF